MHATRGYSHVVETTSPCRTVYIAGQPGRTVDGKMAGGPGDFRAQAVQAFEHVVKVTNYLVDMTHIHTYFEVRDRYVDTKAPPASTTVQISKLAHDGALYEVEAIAVVPEK